MLSLTNTRCHLYTVCTVPVHWRCFNKMMVTMMVHTGAVTACKFSEGMGNNHWLYDRAAMLLIQCTSTVTTTVLAVCLFQQSPGKSPLGKIRPTLACTSAASLAVTAVNH